MCFGVNFKRLKSLLLTQVLWDQNWYWMIKNIFSSDLNMIVILIISKLLPSTLKIGRGRPKS